MNVVSTTPSGTEILYALGVEPVAVSHACDYPPAVEGTPRLDASRIGDGTSRDRHRQVKAAGGHVYDIDAQRLREAEPDVIVTQDVCGVCAVDETTVGEVLSGLGLEPTVVGLNARRLADVFDCIRTVGAATNRDDRANALVANLRGRLERIAAGTAKAGDRPRVAVFEWMDPVHVAANWVPELVELVGGDYGLADPGERSATTPWEAVVSYAPDVVIIAPCSYSVERTTARIAELASHPGWDDLPAVGNGHVYALDGSSYLTRWSPRLVDATERLATVIHPTVFGSPPSDVRRIDVGTATSL